MGKLVNTLRQLIREEIALAEDRLGKGLIIVNPEKAAKIKRLYPEDNMIHIIVKSIEDATDYDMTRLGYKDPRTGTFINGLSQILNMRNTAFGPQVKELIASGVIADKAETAIPKKVKPEKTGKRGRKPSGEDPLLRRINRELSEEPLHEAYRRLQKIK